jgi:hypothetical protein
MDDQGHPLQSFPTSSATLVATTAAGLACCDAGIAIDTVTIVGHPEQFGSPFSAAALFAGMATTTGGSALTLLPSAAHRHADELDDLVPIASAVHDDSWESPHTLRAFLGLPRPLTGPEVSVA